MKRDDQFLRKGYFRTLYPIMLSVLGGTINALIDSAFVSQRLGQEGLAAINLSITVTLIICTVGSLIGGGASVASSIEAGRDNLDEAKRYYCHAFFSALIAGAVISAAGIALCSQLVSLLVQGSGLYTYVYSYCFVAFAGAIFSIVVYVPTYYLQLEGKNTAISIMMGIVIGVDVLLDYLFLFVMDMGMIGASLASVISTIAACVYGFIMLESGYSNYHIQAERLRLSYIRKIIRFGSPTALNNFLDFIKLLLLNGIILYYGGTSALAVWAVLNCLSEFAMSITSGVPQAAAPMSGTYYSARENSGLRIIVKLQVKAGLLLTAAYAAVIIALTPAFERLFAIDSGLLLPLLCLGAFLIFEMLAGIWVSFFQATQRIFLSNLLVLCRKLLFPVLFACVMAFGGGYIFLFLPLGAILTLFAGALATSICCYKSQKTDRPLSRLLLLDDSLERENKVIDFSILPTSENICEASEQIADFCSANHMDGKQTMRIALAIEELICVLNEKNEDLPSVDLRAFALNDITGIRIRCAGIRYNPFEDSGDEDLLMGVQMINKMADAVLYTYSLGMNTINIVFGNETD